MSQNDANNKKTNDEDIDVTLLGDAKKNFLDNCNSLFDGGIDFVKWTTTFSLAAMLYIATIMPSANQNIHGLFGMSIVCFAGSIMVAMFLVYFVLSYRAAQMNNSLEFVNFLLSKNEQYRKWYNIPEVAPIVHAFNIQELEKRMGIFKNPSNFGLIIMVHDGLILAGLTLFIFSL